MVGAGCRGRDVAEPAAALRREGWEKPFVAFFPTLALRVNLMELAGGI